MLEEVPPGADLPTSWATSSPLHDPGRLWPQTNCNLDLWIEYFHHRGLPAEAVLSVLVEITDEGDQMTFSKIDNADIAALFGLDVRELAIFDRLDHHIAMQTARGNMVMVEVDGFHLPDTRATSYQRLHTKTTIGVDMIDPAARHLCYFHNCGHYELAGRDYVAVLELELPDRISGERLFPYTEFVKPARAPLAGAALREAAVAALRQHLAKAPGQNPFISYQARFEADLAMLAGRDPEYFHIYAFNHFRQFGAGFELLGSFARWLDEPGGDSLIHHCDQIAAAAKLLQFRVARAAARRRIDPCEQIFAELASHWDGAFDWMHRTFG